MRSWAGCRRRDRRRHGTSAREHSFQTRARGVWTDERGVNQLDGGWPFYAVYATKDHKHIAVGALEAKFYRRLVELLELDVDPDRQHDRSTWPALRQLLEQRFAERTRDEWARLFDGTDACVAPVLNLAEAGDHPHLAARATMITSHNVAQPAPAPRFSGTPTQPGAPAGVPGADTRAVLTDWQVGEIEDRLHSGAAIQASIPAK